MTRAQSISFLKAEINKINIVIDKKILLGQDWTKERKQHLDLLAQIRKLMGKEIYA